MTDYLASALPLHQLPRETILASVELHHFGILDVAEHKLDRPLWVSDDYACASQYKNLYGAIHHTKFVTSIAFEIVNLNGVSLLSIYGQLNVPNHSEWNKRLAAYLVENGLHGLVYAGREILLAVPSEVIKTTGMISQVCRLDHQHADDSNA